MTIKIRLNELRSYFKFLGQYRSGTYLSKNVIHRFWVDFVSSLYERTKSAQSQVYDQVLPLTISVNNIINNCVE